MSGAARDHRGSSPQIAFVSFFRWLERTTDAGPIRGLFIEFVMDNFARDGGTNLLGTALLARRNHSVASLASSFGLSRNMVSAAAKLVGLLPEGATSNSVFFVARGEAIAEELKADIPPVLSPAIWAATRTRSRLFWQMAMPPGSWLIFLVLTAGAAMPFYA